MAELKNLTVQALRDLARKALGRGHSKLKTKNELIEALQAAEKKVAGAAEKAASKMRDATGRAAKATEKMVESVRARGRATPRPVRKEGAKPAAGDRAKGAKAPSKAGQAAREAARAVREMADAARAGAKRVRAAALGEPEPDPEGHMIARVLGEEAARAAPHPMTEAALEARAARRREPPPPPAGAYDEQLGELPSSYGDDAMIALPRDPRTLFLYWDHAEQTLRQAWTGLEDGRPQLWVFAREADGGWTRLRSVEFALESRSYYVHDLEPGRVYRAEIHLVDRRGRDKLLPRASNEMMLPPVGPSPVIDDKFMRILWGEPLQRMLREARAGGAFPEELRAQLARLSDWSRFAPAAGGSSERAAGAGGAAAGGGMGGRPTSPWMRPSSSSSPSSPWGRPDDGEGR